MERTKAERAASESSSHLASLLGQCTWHVIKSFSRWKMTGTRAEVHELLIFEVISWVEFVRTIVSADYDRTLPFAEDTGFSERIRILSFILSLVQPIQPAFIDNPVCGIPGQWGHRKVTDGIPKQLLFRHGRLASSVA